MNILKNRIKELGNKLKIDISKIDDTIEYIDRLESEGVLESEELESEGWDLWIEDLLS